MNIFIKINIGSISKEYWMAENFVILSVPQMRFKQEVIRTLSARSLVSE